MDNAQCVNRHCQKEFAVATSVKTRKVAKVDDCTQYYLSCPHCGHEVHTHFMGNELEPAFLAVQEANNAHRAAQRQYFISTGPGRRVAPPQGTPGAIILDAAWDAYVENRKAYNAEFTAYQNKVRAILGWDPVT